VSDFVKMGMADETVSGFGSAACAFVLSDRAPRAAMSLSPYTVAGVALRWLYDQRINTPAILDAGRYFPGASDFSARWESLRNEALNIGGRLDHIPRFHEIMKQQTEISANDGRDWRVFVAKAYGAGVGHNLAQCPVLADLLMRHPEVISASFSYLAPGKHIPLHRGPFRGIVRFHLGLSMPLDDSGAFGTTLWIDGTPIKLANGEALLWDDTYPHEVLNATNQVRIALLLDIWRRDMPADIAAFSRILIAIVGVIARIKPDAFTG
jgi:aspartate beta-hydroxylase